LYLINFSNSLQYLLAWISPAAFWSSEILKCLIPLRNVKHLSQSP
jgi:hypothetical protein